MTDQPRTGAQCTQELVAFIEARYAEEDAELDRMMNGELVQGYVRVYGHRLKADIAAKRLILKEHNPFTRSGTGAFAKDFCPTCAEQTYDPRMPYERVIAPCDTLKLLAEPYASRDDFNPAWRQT